METRRTVSGLAELEKKVVQGFAEKEAETEDDSRTLNEHNLQRYSLFFQNDILTLFRMAYKIHWQQLGGGGNMAYPDHNGP